MTVSFYLSIKISQIISISVRSFLARQREWGRPILAPVSQSTSEISANGPSTQRILSLWSPTCEVITRFRESFYRNRLDSWKDHHLLVTMVFDMISLRARVGEKKNNPFVWAFFERIWYSADHSSSALLVGETLPPHSEYPAGSPVLSPAGFQDNPQPSQCCAAVVEESRQVGKMWWRNKEKHRRSDV